VSRAYKVKVCIDEYMYEYSADAFCMPAMYDIYAMYRVCDTYGLCIKRKRMHLHKRKIHVHELTTL
jgi:hypothetical protein